MVCFQKDYYNAIISFYATLKKLLSKVLYEIDTLTFT
jgi:hypothetical protein